MLKIMSEAVEERKKAAEEQAMKHLKEIKRDDELTKIIKDLLGDLEDDGK